uniref:Uncharacterized protein n=1 Tax=Geospiza parvula TaxID=87175 RepID=A0A8C3Q9D3_GEOPR
MLPSQAGAGNGAAAALARGSGLGRSPVPRGANGGGAAAGGARGLPEAGGAVQRQRGRLGVGRGGGAGRRAARREAWPGRGGGGSSGGGARGGSGGGGRLQRRRGRRGRERRQAREEDAGPGEDQDGVHRQQAAALHHFQQEEDRHHEEGLRALHADWHSSPAAGGQRDGPCVHVCHAEAAAHDHQRDGEGADPDVPQFPGLAPRSDPTTDQRMSATGFEETDLTYQVSESDSSGETKDALKPAFTVTNLPGTTSIQTAPTTSTSMQVSSGPSFPITNYLAPVSASISPNAVTSANGTVLKTTGASAVTSGGLMPIPTGFTLMSGGTMAQQVPVQAIQVHQAPQQTSPSSDSSTDLTQTSSSGTVTLPATIMTSSVPTTVGGHMMYPSPHAVMYAPTSGLADGGLAVLNAFPQAPSAMQVSHGQVQDQGGVPQVFLTAPSGTVQIPVSAVQLHQMAVIGQQSSSGSSLTELQVVNLDTSHSVKSD